MKNFNLFLSIICSTISVLSTSIFYILVGANVLENNNRVLLIFIFLIVCAWLPYLFEVIFKLKITKLSLVFYHSFLVLSLILGSTWDFYTIIPFYDIILHTLSGVLIAFIVYNLFKNSKTLNNLSLVWLFILIFSVCLAGGALWEIWEFVTDIITKGNAQNTLNLIGREAIFDTMMDIICDTIGAFVGTTILIILEHKNRNNVKIENPIKNNGIKENASNSENKI